MIPNASADLTIRSKSDNDTLNKSLNLEYARQTREIQLLPGRYLFLLKVEGHPLLESTYVIGRNDRYTLLISGLLPDKWHTNPSSLKNSLKYIFAGIESRDTNSYLPQWFMISNNSGGSQKWSYINIINLNPFTTKITAKDQESSFENTLLYPKSANLTMLEPGNHIFQFFLGNVRIEEKEVALEAGYVYTLLIGKKSSLGKELEFELIKTPLKR